MTSLPEQNDELLRAESSIGIPMVMRGWHRQRLAAARFIMSMSSAVPSREQFTVP
jgi:hypothetical protein